MAKHNGLDPPGTRRCPNSGRPQAMHWPFALRILHAPEVGPPPSPEPLLSHRPETAGVLQGLVAGQSDRSKRGVASEIGSLEVMVVCPV